MCAPALALSPQALLSNEHPLPSSISETQRPEQITIQLGQFKYNSVGKWDMKQDELLMVFPAPGFQEHERTALIVKEK